MSRAGVSLVVDTSSLRRRLVLLRAESSNSL